MKLIATIATALAFVLAPSVAAAATPPTPAPAPAPAPQADGIIAILIGLQFTPPIGSNKGS
jgi:hypothetical protein